MKELNLNNQLKNQDFVSKTISQIEKDFGRCNLDIHLTQFSDRDSLEDEIFGLIQNLSSDKLQQLMYIIDIQENDFSKLLGTEFFHKALAEKILRREALKVFLRENLLI
jgi:hypothetical protein